MMGSPRFILSAVLLTALGGGTLALWGSSRGVAEFRLDEVLVHHVERGEFESTVTEPGDLESASNIDIRCQVRSRGSPGTVILQIIEEGTFVQPGDLLVQFDDSALQEELIEQKITVAHDRASVIQSQSDLHTAERALREYEQGIFEQERSVIEAEVALAEETLRRAEEYYRHSLRLSVRGYVTDSQLEADQYAVIKATKDVELSRQRLEVFELFTRERMVAELSSEIEKQQANLEAAEYTLQLSRQREVEIAEQIVNCTVLAPDEGMVVYANESDRGDSSIVIEEGVFIRDGQVIIRLPDPDDMQVVTLVNDSKINLIDEGDNAVLWLDSDPEQPIQGEVTRVASFPLPRRWHQAPIEYKVYVRVTERRETVRPGLRAKVQIYVERRADALQAPVSSLVSHRGRYFVLVREDDRLEAREVEVGPNNNKFVVIEGGLTEGEPVVIDAEKYRQYVEFPPI